MKRTLLRRVLGELNLLKNFHHFCPIICSFVTVCPIFFHFWPFFKILLINFSSFYPFLPKFIFSHFDHYLAHFCKNFCSVFGHFCRFFTIISHFCNFFCRFWPKIAKKLQLITFFRYVSDLEYFFWK